MDDPASFVRGYKVVREAKRDGGVSSCCGAVYASLCDERTTWEIGRPNIFADGTRKPELHVHGFHACLHPAALFLREVARFPCSVNEEGVIILTVLLEGTVVSDGLTCAALCCTPVGIVSKTEFVAMVKGHATLVSSSTKLHLLDGQLHSPNDFTPAFDQEREKRWYKHGLLHRAGDRPAVVTPRMCCWFMEGKRHRDKGLPAVIDLGPFPCVAFWEHGTLLGHHKKLNAYGKYEGLVRRRWLPLRNCEAEAKGIILASLSR